MKSIFLVNPFSNRGHLDAYARLYSRALLELGYRVVLVAEATGVGSGLGQVVMLARNTFNSSLSFFTMTLIGVTGFAFDVALRIVQRKVLFWVPSNGLGK